MCGGRVTESVMLGSTHIIATGRSVKLFTHGERTFAPVHAAPGMLAPIPHERHRYPRRGSRDHASAWVRNPTQAGHPFRPKLVARVAAEARCIVAVRGRAASVVVPLFTVSNSPAEANSEERIANRGEPLVGGSHFAFDPRHSPRPIFFFATSFDPSFPIRYSLHFRCPFARGVRSAGGAWMLVTHPDRPAMTGGQTPHRTTGPSKCPPCVRCAPQGARGRVRYAARRASQPDARVRRLA
jgi:hypothetical protein